MKKIFLFIGIIYLSTFHSFAGNDAPFRYDSVSKTLILTSPSWSDHIQLSDYIETYIDSTNAFSFQEISKNENQKLFKQYDGKIDPKKTNRTVWGKLEIKNVSASNSEWKLLPYYHTRVTFYCLYSSGKISEQYTGTEVATKDRSVAALVPVFEMSLRQGESAILFFKLESKKSDWFNALDKIFIDLTTDDIFEKSQTIEWTVQGIFSTFMLLTILYSLLLFIVVRERSFLYLILFCLFNLLLCLDLSGVSTVLIWKEFPLFYIVLYGIPIWYMGVFLFAFLFTDKLLSLKNTLPRFRVYYLGFLLLFCCAELFRCISNNIAISVPIVNYLAIICLLLLLFAVIYLAIKGNRQAKFLTLATLLLFIGGIFSILALEGIVSINFQYASQMGIALYILTISIVAVDKVRIMREEKEELIREQNIVLEKKVEERTKELQDTQQQLIETEKLATFGAVATRVAHEIQNPLNFVNNFSDLSAELIDEIESAKTDEERKDIYTDIKTNLKKINEHGKRADAIVKELIEHTRAGTTHQYFEDGEK